MAIAITVNADYQSITGKTLSIQAELTSKLKTGIIDIVYTTQDYTTGGDVVDLSLDGRFKTIIAVEVLEVSTGNSVQYIHGTASAAALGKLKFYETGTTSAPFDEVANAVSLTANMKLRIFGY